MGNRTQEFFDWVKSIGKLDLYEDSLDLSYDFSDEERRHKAINTLIELDKDFIKYAESK
tara:strand:- start:91 stop:267 length:177 start_codon:yes stop_codon:yes gene_type:complete